MHENDIAAPHFAALITLLETVTARRDYENPAILQSVAQCAAAARSAGVPPERALAYLRFRLQQAPLAAVGDWYRGVLTERIIAHAINVWYAEGRDPNETEASRDAIS